MFIISDIVLFIYKLGLFFHSSSIIYLALGCYTIVMNVHVCYIKIKCFKKKFQKYCNCFYSFWNPVITLYTSEKDKLQFDRKAFK